MCQIRARCKTPERASHDQGSDEYQQPFVAGACLHLKLYEFSPLDIPENYSTRRLRITSCHIPLLHTRFESTLLQHLCLEDTQLSQSASSEPRLLQSKPSLDVYGKSRGHLPPSWIQICEAFVVISADFAQLSQGACRALTSWPKPIPLLSWRGLEVASDVRCHMLQARMDRQIESIIQSAYKVQASKAMGSRLGLSVYDSEAPGIVPWSCSKA